MPKSLLDLALLLVVSAALAGAQQANVANMPVIDTPPTLAQCLPAMITFSGGVKPYYIAALPGGQTQATPLVDFGKQDSNSLTWKVNLAANTTVSLRVTDGSGKINYSQQVTVQKSDDSSCVGTNTSPTTTQANPADSQTSATSTTTPSSTGSTTNSTGATASSSTNSKGSSPFSTSGSNTTASTNAKNLGVTKHAIGHQKVLMGLAIVTISLTCFG